jgi:NAD(P)-dependent dehydrogenase (short-subunit alcohol dehydrogenase family)
MKLIADKALVFGGGRGVGRATAVRFAEAGADIAFVYRANEEAASETARLIEAQGRKAVPIKADVSQPTEVKRAVEEAVKALGGYSILVNTTGAPAPTKPIRALEPEEWLNFINVDLNGAFYVAHFGIGPLREAGGGAIVMMSSIATRLMPSRNANGAAAKAGVEALVHVLAREEARSGIRANCVSIGITDTDMTRPILEAWGEETTKKVLAGIPMGRIGKPEEVASMIAYLASEDGAYITGKVIEVDGGQFIGG